jgi:membrane protein
MAIVPLLAMCFGVAKGFGFDSTLETLLIKNFQGQQEVLHWLIRFSHSLLDSVQGGLMAAIGLVLLFWSVIQVMTQIEGSFNEIWGIRRSRSFVRRFADYLAMMVVVPLVVGLAGSTNVLFITQLRDLSGDSALVELMTPFLMVLAKVAPYVLIWLAFTLMYLVMPHTRVRWTAALLSGVLMGTVYQLLQWFYIDLQVGVARYSAIYGSFAALPLLLIWMQAGWLIILFGARMTYSIQNMRLHEFEKEAADMSAYERRSLSLYVFRAIILHYRKGGKALSSRTLSDQLKLPLSVVRTILDDLIECSLVVQVSLKKRNRKSLQPAKDYHLLKVSEVCHTLDRRGDNSLLMIHARDLRPVEEVHARMQQAMDEASGEMTLDQLL